MGATTAIRGTALRQAANTLIRSRSYLGARYRRFRTKRGAPKAITAMAHRLARLVYRSSSTVKPMSTKGLSTTKNDSVNSKSTYSGNGRRNLNFTLRKFMRESKFLERGCQEKILFPPLAGEVDVWLASSPVPFVEGFFVFGALDRRVLLRRCQPQWLVSRKWFHLAVGA